MDPATGIAAAQVAGNFVTGLINSNSNKKANRESIAASKEMAQTQNDWNLEQWNRQNAKNLENWKMEQAYNTPSNQVARMADAGLNKTLMYSGNVSNTSSSVPASKSPSAADYETKRVPFKVPQLPNIASEIAAYQDIRYREAQISNLKDTNNLIAAQEAYTRSRTLGTQAGTLKTQTETKRLQELRQPQIDKINADISLVKSSTSLKDKEFAIKSLEHTLKNKLHAAGVTTNDSYVFRLVALMLYSGKLAVKDIMKFIREYEMPAPQQMETISPESPTRKNVPFPAASFSPYVR